MEQLKTIEGRIVERLFTDLRDRRTLKWMFDEEDHGHPTWIDKAVQNEIRSDWRALIRQAMREDTPCKPSA